MRDDVSTTRGDGAESLSVQVAGGQGEPERLFLMTRPRDGTVEVREFRFGDSEAVAREYAASAGELLERFEGAHRARRRLSEDMHRIRRWLNG